MCDVIDLRADFLRNIWACDNGRRTDRNWKGKYPKTAAAVFAVSFTCVTVDGAYEDDMRKTTCIKKYYSASITVEASIILSVVLLSLAAFIRYAYTVHDAVTGSMILERCYAQNMGGGTYKSNLPDNLEIIKEVGYKNVMVDTDGGQTENPHWELAIEEYMQYLLDHGIPEEQVYHMTHTIPAGLLGI